MFGLSLSSFLSLLLARLRLRWENNKNDRGKRERETFSYGSQWGSQNVREKKYATSSVNAAAAAGGCIPTAAAIQRFQCHLLMFYALPHFGLLLVRGRFHVRCGMHGPEMRERKENMNSLFHRSSGVYSGIHNFSLIPFSSSSFQPDENVLALNRQKKKKNFSLPIFR